jgi:splicing factor 3B subunit 3
LALEKLGAVFNQVAFPLQYTPRKFVIHPESNNLIIIETDHNAYTEATKAQRKQQMAEVITLTSRGAISKRLPVKLFRKV